MSKGWRCVIIYTLHTEHEKSLKSSKKIISNVPTIPTIIDDHPHLSLTLLLAIIIDDLVNGDRPRVLHNRPSDRVDPILLLLLRIGNEVHGFRPSGELERELLVEHVLGALDREAGGHRDDTTWLGTACDDGFLEPEEFTLLEDEPAAAPRLDVLALLG